MSKLLTALPPRFTVVIAHHEQPAWLDEAVTSALAQEPATLLEEVVVVDDGSSQATRSALAHQRSRWSALQGSRVRWIEQVQGGQASAWYRGVLAARGSHIAFLDADDRFEPDKLRVVADVLQRWPGLPFVAHDAHVRDEASGRVLERSLLGLDESVLQRLTLVGQVQPVHFPVPCGIILSREVAQELLDAMPRDDWWQGADGTLNLAAWLRTGTVGLIGRRLATYRVHGGNHFARVSDGRLRALPRSQQRTPKRLAFLERLLDGLDLPVDHRRAAQAQVAGIAREHHLTSASPSARAAARTIQTVRLADGAQAWPAVARAFGEGPGPIVHVAGPDDRLHPWFLERMAHHHATLPALVVGCDTAIHDPSGTRIAEQVLERQGRLSGRDGAQASHRVWPGFPQWRPWPLGPLATLTVKRTPLTRAWVAHCERRASAHAKGFPSLLLAAGPWALGGAALADETWVSVVQDDADVGARLGHGEPLPDPGSVDRSGGFAWFDLPVLLLGFVIEADEATRSRLPHGWPARLGRWAAELLPPPLAAQMAAHAHRAGLTELAQPLLAQRPADAAPINPG